jgi:CheY-like chemotaxis protein
MSGKVLVAEDDPVFARLLKKALEGVGLEVEVVGDGNIALDFLQGRAFDGLVADWMLPGLDGPDVVRHARALETQPGYVALISGLNTPAARAHALAAGADEFFAKPLMLAKVSQSVKARLSLARVAQPKIAPAHPLAQTAAWRTLPDFTRQVLADTLNVALSVSPSRAFIPEGALAVVVPLSSVERGLELEMTLESPTDVIAELAAAFVGEPLADEEALFEVIAELVNIAAGRVKANFDAEKVPLTLGLPKRRDPSVPPCDFSQTVTFALESGQFTVSLLVRERPVTTAKASELREGMVVAENIYGDGGGLLLNAGARLTMTSAMRLHGLGDRELRVLK